MSFQRRTTQFLICDDNAHTRRMVADVLIGAGYEKVDFAADGRALLRLSEDLNPRVVLTSSRIPGISGLDYTRRIRAGYRDVSRVTSIIVMTDTPTQSFLTAARDAGVDEMLVRPFTGQAVLARVEAVLLRPRRFVESVSYVGPCRRRRMLDEYGGPQRRMSDKPANDADAADFAGAPWAAEANRAVMRGCVDRIAKAAHNFDPLDRAKLREVDAAVREAEQLAGDIGDNAMIDAARSLLRYLSAMGATGKLDPEVVRTHLSAMYRLGDMGAAKQAERAELSAGLIAVVDKRLGRKTAAA